MLCEFMMYTLGNASSKDLSTILCTLTSYRISQLRLLHGHSGSVDHVAFDGNAAVSGGSD